MIARAKIPVQIRRNLTVVDACDGQTEQLVFRRRSDRIAPLRLVAVLGGEPDIDMLARHVSSPAGYVKEKTLYSGRFDHDFAHLRELPLQSTRQPGRPLNRRHTSVLSRGLHSCDSRTLPRSRAR